MEMRTYRSGAAAIEIEQHEPGTAGPHPALFAVAWIGWGRVALDAALCSDAEQVWRSCLRAALFSEDADPARDCGDDSGRQTFCRVAGFDSGCGELCCRAAGDRCAAHRSAGSFAGRLPGGGAGCGGSALTSSDRGFRRVAAGMGRAHPANHAAGSHFSMETKIESSP